jgi:cyanate permease
MALGGWMGGAIHDLTGGYSAAFLAGFAFMNLVIIAALYTRQIRLGLSDVPA